MSAQEEMPPLRLQAGPVLVGTVRVLMANWRWLPRLLGLPALAAFAAALVHVYALPGLAGTAVWVLTVPLLVLLAVAWHRLILLGPKAVRAPAVRWRGRHTRYLGVALGVAGIHFLLYGVLVVAVAGMPMDTTSRLVGLLVTLWFTVTLFTPLTLKLPSHATGQSVPARAWQTRPAHFGNAALVWLGVVPATAVLLAGAGLLIAPFGAPVPVHLAATLVGAALVPLTLLLPVTAISLMFRALRSAKPSSASWPG
ncbi:hypothetical protein SAMN05216241_108106 [Limimonas halophila]|uniref:Uncharacterized protein n=1 Tax=Limimonas halophila TaxID=1082479 RepID=A0A1G7T5Y8_9PROT|nr:hypothetical protein [Limimonas halophila]SDG30648.1 hypothetical protein SAMN05216241_108106 [Limimonas halophila]